MSTNYTASQVRALLNEHIAALVRTEAHAADLERSLQRFRATQGEDAYLAMVAVLAKHAPKPTGLDAERRRDLVEVAAKLAGSLQGIERGEIRGKELISEARRYAERATGAFFKMGNDR